MKKFLSSLEVYVALISTVSSLSAHAFLPVQLRLNEQADPAPRTIATLFGVLALVYIAAPFRNRPKPRTGIVVAILAGIVTVIYWFYTEPDPPAEGVHRFLPALLWITFSSLWPWAAALIHKAR